MSGGITDGELLRLIVEMDAERDARLDAVRRAMASPRHRYRGRAAGHFAVAMLSARPDCPPGWLQVTRLHEGPSGVVPMGHSYCDDTPEALEAELSAQGYDP